MTQSDASGIDVSGTPEEAAAAAFLRLRAGQDVSEPPPQGMLRAERAWQAVGDHAAAPELIAMRTQALGRLRRANARRWLGDGAGNGRRRALAAALAGIAVALGIVWQLSPHGYSPGQYETGTGEQRVLDLDDGSRLALDAQTKVRVRYTDDVRLVQMIGGQAQFSVARDPRRPFRVEAGEHTIVALGTSFSVEYVDEQVQVAMIEGRVLVTVAPRPDEPKAAPGAPAAGSAHSTELAAGEGLRVRSDGEATFISEANVAAATAWRQGKVIFDAEPLSEAARRLNRYSRLQVVIDDPQLAQLSVSGMFEVGDSREFVHVMESYLQLKADYSEAGVVRLQRAR
jgi:transmembrane sensor